MVVHDDADPPCCVTGVDMCMGVCGCLRGATCNVRSASNTAVAVAVAVAVGPRALVVVASWLSASSWAGPASQDAQRLLGLANPPIPPYRREAGHDLYPEPPMNSFHSTQSHPYDRGGDPLPPGPMSCFFETFFRWFCSENGSRTPAQLARKKRSTVISARYRASSSSSSSSSTSTSTSTN
ncbi:hypothetical protein COCMIDRAFT_22049 [Bipolaris oryzae ATCC 44560]|uniref:Uncharacterized protein n=1 Tax=Bipolaris oryzae ATCC 44560 TaxID=930090 RepID=W6ZF38_COCMI|nr:uncharacterized protein COCMIDRAFT_22049 [Bipolaris oryzae ATCC 44560]EUC50437.1 hypothetical protein COCMIDRAFT_22049 [Bipolaris oryzae ATCC 44560]